MNWVHRIRRLWRRRKPWSPFGPDGRLRDDLFAVREVDGRWVPNPKPNDGFWPLGALREDES